MASNNCTYTTSHIRKKNFCKSFRQSSFNFNVFFLCVINYPLTNYATWVSRCASTRMHVFLFAICLLHVPVFFFVSFSYQLLTVKVYVCVLLILAVLPLFVWCWLLFVLVIFFISQLRFRSLLLWRIYSPSFFLLLLKISLILRMIYLKNVNKTNLLLVYVHYPHFSLQLCQTTLPLCLWVAVVANMLHCSDSN